MRRQQQFPAAHAGALQHRQQRHHHRQQPHAGEPDRDAATSNRLAPAPSVEIRITCAGPAQTSTVEASAHVTREAEIMRQRADAHIGAEQHVAEHRGPGGAEARQIGGKSERAGGSAMAFCPMARQGAGNRRRVNGSHDKAAAALHNGGDDTENFE